MAEYIERDEAVRKALEACVKVVGHGITQIEAVDIADIIDGIPTADVVPVVRCKDCEHFKTDSYYCKKTNQGYCEFDDMVKSKYHYCGYGERRCDNDS